MASIIMTCPKCTSTKWSLMNLDLVSYLCAGCGQWIEDEALVVDFVEDIEVDR